MNTSRGVDRHARYRVGVFTNAAATFVQLGELRRVGYQTPKFGVALAIMTISNLVLAVQGIVFSSWWAALVPILCIDLAAVYYLGKTLKTVGQEKNEENCYFPGEWIQVEMHDQNVTFNLNSRTSFTCPLSAIARIERRPLRFVTVYFRSEMRISLPRRAVPTALLASFS